MAFVPYDGWSPMKEQRDREALAKRGEDIKRQIDAHLAGVAAGTCSGEWNACSCCKNLPGSYYAALKASRRR